ncbi:gas vesicle protein [Actinomadura roseirufa]|uniref:gas vesicle protein n=1 Tax=Actinomadura roseirufa TaxID=2094049 RepID=UPI0010415ADB|nr:gas vesicle protein [Actinomadura roseirufa]
MTAVLDTGPGAPAERVALVDLLDRLLSGGVVITGDLVISIAEIDLVHVSLRALVTAVRDGLDPEEEQ